MRTYLLVFCLGFRMPTSRSVQRAPTSMSARRRTALTGAPRPRRRTSRKVTASTSPHQPLNSTTSHDAPRPRRRTSRKEAACTSPPQPPSSTTSHEDLPNPPAAWEARMSRLESLLEGQAREIIRLRTEPPTASATFSAVPPAVPDPTCVDQTLGPQGPASLPGLANVSSVQSQPLPASAGTNLLSALPVSDQAAREAVINDVMDHFATTSKGNDQLAPYLLPGATLPHAVKSKIWAGQYVDLSSLKPQGSKSTPKTVAVHGEAGTTPTFTFADNEKPVLPKTTSDWLQLFGIYMTVYLQAHPSEGPQISAYLLSVLELSNRSSGIWAQYDVRFRSLRALCPSQLPWGRINWELVHTLEQQDKSTVSLSLSSQPAQHPRACYSFLYKGVCNRHQCPYSHICTYCRKQGHSFITCRAKNGNNIPPAQTSTPSSAPVPKPLKPSRHN